MKYVMRAGDLAEGLLPSGNLYIELIALRTDNASMS